MQYRVERYWNGNHGFIIKIILNVFLCMRRYLMGYLSLHSITSDFVPVLQSRKAKSWNDVKQGCITFISFSLLFTVQKWVWQANSYYQVPNFDALICGMWRNIIILLLRRIHSKLQGWKCVTKMSCWNILKDFTIIVDLLVKAFYHQLPSFSFVMGTLST